MNEEFIPYEQALQLKELGFDEPCFNYYNNDNEDTDDKTFILFPYLHVIGIKNSERIKNKRMEMTISAPLYQQVFDWFLDKYNLFGYVNTGFCPFKNEPKSKTRWVGIVKGVNIRGLSSSDTYFKEVYTVCFKNINEAKLECIKLLIKSIKTL